MDNTRNFEEELSRLVRMLGSDPAFYLLALHSFVEMVLNRELGLNELFFEGEHYRFSDKMYLYRQKLLAKMEEEPGASPRVKGVSHLNQLVKSHHLTNRTRHEFGAVSVEEAKAGTWSFLEFCRLSGIDSPLFRKIRDNLDIWDERQSPIEHLNELKKIRFSLHIKDMEIDQLNRRLSELAAWEKQANHLAALLKDRENKLEQLDEKSGRRDRILAELEAERDRLSGELRDVRLRIASSRDVSDYREEMIRLSNYTRTRRDFERSIVRLSEEQREAVESAPDDGLLLIRGGAGTGKTIVLLESLRRASLQEGLFDGGASPSGLGLLTYARTLVKYDRYISEILGIADDRLTIRTVDSYVNEVVRRRWPRSEIRYGSLISEALEELGMIPPAPLDRRDLAREIDEFIWGYHLSREEYVTEMISRSGLRHRLDEQARQRVWEIQGELRAELVDQELFTRNLAVCLMLEEGSSAVKPEDPAPEFDQLYVDEVQDLPPVVLEFLAGRSRRLVMAGDIDQSIYGLQSPFARAGIDIRGRSRILNQNFRNTMAILELAEAYREASGLARDYPEGDRRRAPKAFREGPPVALLRHSDKDALEDELISRLRFFRESLGYDPENLCIIAPDNRSVDRLIARMAREADLEGISIRDPQFEFGEGGENPGGKVRLSPLHSTKGLDFPVVFLFLPFLHGVGGLDRRLQDSQRKNLLYVGLTRAMDHLEIFLSDWALENPVISPILSCWEAMEGR
jgi:superfamily I DNA/RNA helicase